jgi:hypothetical protein
MRVHRIRPQQAFRKSVLVFVSEAGRDAGVILALSPRAYTLPPPVLMHHRPKHRLVGQVQKCVWRYTAASQPDERLVLVA